MSESAVTYGRDAHGTYVVFEGVKTWRSWGSPADLTAEAEDAERRAEREAYRARRARAMAADLAEREEAERVALAERRRARAAATRAHNRDPFGFRA